jgi:antitoxin component YwqK of YwqJK toxin-antitoxin module
MSDSLSTSAAPSVAASFAGAASGVLPHAPRPTVVEECDATGQIVSRVSMLAGMPHGEMVRYSAPGVLLLEAHYVDGQLSGPLRTFDANGALVSQASYLAGRQHGLTTLYQDDRIAARRQYALGVLHGESVSYAPSGLVTSRLHYEAGRLEREAVYLHDGAIVRRAHYRAGLLDGETRDYSGDGALVQSSPYQRDLLHGTVRRFGPDGQVREERRYANGKPLGEWRSVAATAQPHDAAGDTPRLVKHLEKWMRG